jgi:hypothetical protein
MRAARRCAHIRVIGENEMRGRVPHPIVATLLLAFVTFVLASIASTPARAFGKNHTFCLTGDE